jgi:hypothetical protein
MAAGHGKQRQLTATTVQVRKLQKKIHKSESVINFYRHKGKWTLHKPGTKHGEKKCWQVTGFKRRKVCTHARKTFAHHAKRLVRLERKLQSLMPWVHDVNRTEEYRRCIISYESSRSGYGNYTAENGGTPGVESSVNSDASGAYQFLDSTWRARLDSAEKFYGIEISNTSHAAYAEPWAQDVVAAYSIVDPGLRGRDWTHSRCRAISVSA